MISPLGLAPFRGRNSNLGHKMLVLATGLLMWGLPSVRFTPRSVEAAFTGLSGMDFTAWFQVGTCIFTAIIAIITCASRISQGFSALPLMLFSGATRSFLIYSAFAMGSAIYSVNVGLTIYSASKMLLVLVCSALLARSYGGGSRGIAVCLRLFYIVNILQWVVIAVLFLSDPELVGGIDPKVGYRLNGGSFGDYGRAAAFSGLFFIVVGLRSHGRRRWSAFAGYALSWIFVLLSLTRGTMICATLMLCLAVASQYRARWRVLVACASLLLVSVVTLSGGLEEIIRFSARGETRADLESLTGRAQAFHFLMERRKESPWLGLGYGAGSRYLLLHFREQAGLGIGAAHDAVSRVLTDLGSVGATVLCVAFIHSSFAIYAMWGRTRHHTELRGLAVQVVGLFVYCMIFSVISSGIAEVTAPVVIVALATTSLRIRQRPAKEPGGYITPVPRVLSRQARQIAVPPCAS
jgi:O-Antigen ligase